jgi:hypothetical protein
VKLELILFFKIWIKKSKDLTSFTKLRTCEFELYDLKNEIHFIVKFLEIKFNRIIKLKIFPKSKYKN